MEERYEQFKRVYHIYDGVNGECAYVDTGEEYCVLTSDDELIPMESRTPAGMYAALRALYGDIPLVEDRDVVPIDIAVAGKPAMASYQYMAHYEYYSNIDGEYRYNEGLRAIGEHIGVNKNTVKKYFRRVVSDANEIKIGGSRDRHYWR